MPAGSIVIRDMRTWHRGMANTTNKLRTMLSLVYFRQYFPPDNLSASSVGAPDADWDLRPSKMDLSAPKVSAAERKAPNKVTNPFLGAFYACPILGSANRQISSSKYWYSCPWSLAGSHQHDEGKENWRNYRSVGNTVRCKRRSRCCNNGGLSPDWSFREFSPIRYTRLMAELYLIRQAQASFGTVRLRPLRRSIMAEADELIIRRLVS